MHNFNLKKARTHQWTSRNQSRHPSSGVQITLSGKTVQKMIELFSPSAPRSWHKLYALAYQAPRPLPCKTRCCFSTN